ncbi:MAG: peptide transporter [Phycisphaeraceae bacterium]|nr:peptide transporter [Phycisphaeraceae bacterium]
MARKRRPQTEDAELALYRGIMTAPGSYEEGFTGRAIVGALFCGVVMVPGSIYLGLLSGGSMNVAASWVTLILFAEVARRALVNLRKQEMIILLGVAGAMSGGGPMGELIYRQFLVNSSAMREAGLSDAFPDWFAPGPQSQAILERTFFHRDWMLPILVTIAILVIHAVRSYVSGYIFFRLTSDIEKLPFPMAPIAAAGSLALVEAGERSQSWRWTVFSSGALIGVAFAVVHALVPLVTGAVLERPITLIPLPWVEMTPLLQIVLPAVAFGIAIDLFILMTGFVVPFWAVMGTLAGIVLTMVLNPILYHYGVLHTWQPGMETINTQLANALDFWFSAGIGIALGLAVVSIVQTVLGVRAAIREARGQKTDRSEALRGGVQTPPGRGDFPMWIAVAVYVLCAVCTLVLCVVLIREPTPWLIGFLIFYVLVYGPLMSYVNARLVGICGQTVAIPFIREGMFILSGYRGIDVWISPAIASAQDAEREGASAQEFRQMELTGTRFWSMAKSRALTLPLSFLMSLFFWAYIWHSNAIPSSAFPYAEQMWELQARGNLIMWSATMGGEGETTMFQQAFHPDHIVISCLLTVALFLVFRWAALPVMFIYGIILGAGGLPHMLVMQVVGAFLARFYFHRKYGAKRFLEIAPVLLAGYATGAGLIAMLGVAFALIAKSTVSVTL